MSHMAQLLAKQIVKNDIKGCILSLSFNAGTYMLVMHRLFFEEYTKKKQKNKKRILEKRMEELEWWRDFAGSCMHFIFTMCRYYFLN